MSEIKPCQCGGQAFFEELGASRGIYCVKCDSCRMKSVYVELSEKENAIKCWEYRPVEEALRIENERLRKIVDELPDLVYCRIDLDDKQQVDIADKIAKAISDRIGGLG